MTPDLIDLARRAMALPGAPRIFDRDGTVGYVTVPMPSAGRTVTCRVWDLDDSSESGGTLGGLLLWALEGAWTRISRQADSSVRITDIERGAVAHFDGANLAQACCRRAVEYGCWPGGVE